MSRHWKQPFDPDRDRDFMSGAQDAGGRPRAPSVGPAWTYFVVVDSFTFEFASVDQLRECLAYCNDKVHPATREPGIRLEHYWQRWFERLPAGLLRGEKRRRVVEALQRALAEFETD